MKIKCFVSLGLVGCKVEDIFYVPDDDLEDLNEEELKEHLQEEAEEWLWDSSGMEFWWEIIEEKE